MFGKGFWLAAQSIAAAIVLAASAAAQDSGGNRETEIQASLVRLAEQPPDAAAALLAARKRLLARIEQLEQDLANTGSETSRSWSEWLDLPRLQAEAHSPAPDVPALEAIAERFYCGQAGLEAEPFVAVRRELRGFLAAREYAAADDPPDLYRRRVLDLSESLARLGTAANNDDVHRAGLRLAWLEPLSDEGSRAAQAVRARFCTTNGVIQASGRAANLLLRRDVAQQKNISEIVLGNYTWGVAFMQGHVSVAIVPSAASGALEIRLQGQAICPANVAERRRVSVQSSAATSISASKRMSITDLGLQLAPASAACWTSVQIQDVDAPRRLLERIAWRRANRVVPDAEAAASRRAESQSAAQLDGEAQELLRGINDLYYQKVRAPLIRGDALPPLFQFWSDASHLRLALAQYNQAQLAPASPPPLLPPELDLGGSAHHSLLNNLSESLLGGKTIEDQIWHDMLQILLGTPPRPLWIHDRAERWSVTLARQRPLDVRFESDRVHAVLRLARVTRGAEQLEVPVEIEASFAPQITRDGPLLVRDGDLTIRCDDPDLHKFLRRKFGAILPPELAFSGLAPPAGGTLGKLRQLKLVEFRSAGGWLSVGYQLTPAAAPGP